MYLFIMLLPMFHIKKIKEDISDTCDPRPPTRKPLKLAKCTKRGPGADEWRGLVNNLGRRRARCGHLR